MNTDTNTYRCNTEKKQRQTKSNNQLHFNRQQQQQL